MSVLSLDEAKAHLNITRPDDESKVQDFIDAAESYIAGQVGPLAAVVVSQRAPVWQGRVVPSGSAPILSVSSVATPAGTDVSYTFNAGIAQVLVSGASACEVDITFRAGWSDPDSDPVVALPVDLLLAVKEMLRHLWEASQRGANRRNAPGPDATMPGYLVPNMVASLIAPYRVPGVA
jgi:hypothetical protein